MNECQLDEHGQCKTHAPGTEGEAKLANKILDESRTLVKKALQPVYAAWRILVMIEPAMRAYQEKNPTANVPELALLTAMEKLLVAGADCAKSIEALAVPNPNAS